MEHETLGKTGGDPGCRHLPRPLDKGRHPRDPSRGVGGGDDVGGAPGEHRERALGTHLLACVNQLQQQAKALGDPIRLQLVDVLRKHAGKVCVCELIPLFDVSQSTVSHHLKVLREAGLVDSERRGLWAYYYVNPDALKELSAWLS